MTKIVFAGHDLKFATHIINHFERKEDYEVRIDQWTSHTGHDESHSLECLDWADVIVCEWGLGNAVWYSNRKHPNQKLVVRMHLQEVKTDYPNQFDMQNIDRIIAISPYVYEEFYRTFKIPRKKMTMIYNVVDTWSFDREKEASSSYNLGFIGMSPKRKRLDKAIDILEELWSKDSRYRLFIKGKDPMEYPWIRSNEEESNYYQALFTRIEEAPWKDAVIFDGYGNDIPEWFTKIGFTLSTSDFESFHLSPSEGMASGAYPIILNWDGSNTIYPKKYLFSSINEAASEINRVNGIEENDHLMEEAKSYVQDHFSVEKVTADWECLIDSIAK
ncbi:UNVERIFIED_CONTAM: glycosyltransferase family 4 protein [Halobacillus marinus]